MNRKFVCWQIVSLILAVLLCCAAFAQVDAVTPVAGVRGSGAIQISNTNYGMFDINVAQFPPDPTGAVPPYYGGFRFAEVDETGAVTNAVVSTGIKSLVFPAPNIAVVVAIGYWSIAGGTPMECEITLTAEDHGTTGDKLTIVARPTGPLDIIYPREGPVVKGDIQVFGKVQPVGYTKGNGAFYLKTTSNVSNVGVFDFYAQSGPTTAAWVGTEGKIFYAEFNPRVASIIARPIVQINVPKVASLVIDPITRKQAIMQGIGTLNGMRASVTVMVQDNWNPLSMMPFRAADTFSIEARILNSDKVYRAQGSLFRGDIVVVVLNAVP